MPSSALTPAIKEEIARLGCADIMVGIPSFRNAATIGHVVRAAQAGLVQYFPDLRPILVNADAGSPDGTQRVVVETEPPGYVEQILLVHPTNRLDRVSLTYPEVDGIGGKGAALRTLFEIAAELKVEALVVVDSDLRSIVPEWIELLAGPILKGGYDFVAPLYGRHKYDGTITNTVTYPVTRALYGHRIRQPIGGDFGVSGDLIRYYLEQESWTPDVSRFGIDIWMTTTALTGGFAVCQTRLGAKIHDPKDPGSDLGPMFRQVVGTLMTMARDNAARWLPITGSHDVPAYGFERFVDPVPLEVNTLRLLAQFHSGFADARRYVGTADRAGQLQARAGPGRRSRSAGRVGGSSAWAEPRVRRGHGRRKDADHGRDVRRGRRVPLPGRPVGPRLLRPAGFRQLRRRARGAARGGARADLLRPGRQPRHRDPAPLRGTGRGAGGATGAGVRAAEAVSRGALARGRGERRRCDRPRGRCGRGRHGRRGPMTRSPLPSRILIPVANPLTAEELVRLGASLMDRRTGSLTVLGIVEVPEGTPLSEGATRARQARRLLQRVLDFAPEGVTIHPIVRIGRRAAEGVVEAATELESDLIVFGWGGKPPARPGAPAAVFSPTIDEVVRDAPCDIAVVKQRGPAEIKRVLVPIRGGPHAVLALRFADALARRNDGKVVALHLIPQNTSEGIRAQAQRALSHFIRQHADGQVEQQVREAANVRNAILRESENADVVVMGASAAPATGQRRDVPLRGAAGGRDGPIDQDGDRRQDARGDRQGHVRETRGSGRDAGRSRTSGP